MAAEYAPNQVMAETAAAKPCYDSSSPLLTAGFLFLSVNSGFAAYRGRQDPWMLAFILSAYSNLVLLLVSLRAYERTPDLHVQRRQRLKLVIFVLSSTLNLSFSYHVAKMLPPPLSAAVWSIACIVTAGGFFLLFVYDGASRDGKDYHAETVDSRVSCKETDALVGDSAT